MKLEVDYELTSTGDKISIGFAQNVKNTPEIR